VRAVPHTRTHKHKRDDSCPLCASQAYDQFLGFVFRLNESVKAKPLSTECHVSPVPRVSLAHPLWLCSRSLTVGFRVCVCVCVCDLEGRGAYGGGSKDHAVVGERDPAPPAQNKVRVCATTT
jgi:hypothetical protein